MGKTLQLRKKNQNKQTNKQKQTKNPNLLKITKQKINYIWSSNIHYLFILFFFVVV